VRARELRCSTVRIVGQCWHSSQVEFIPGSAELRVSADRIDDLAQMGKIDSAEELQRAWKSRIHEDVASTVDQMGAADAFDLIELMRLREVPISPVLGLHPNFEGRGAALEMVALMLTCRPSRLPADPDRAGAVPPDQLVPDLHERSMRLLPLSALAGDNRPACKAVRLAANRRCRRNYPQSRLPSASRLGTSGEVLNRTAGRPR
jgi:hypothetical protein